ncbi:Galactose/methyl galactoside import ATP-binding protein MglA [bioreactor metagenome]|uniref:Galactose/methyl galactoside import ATP-binding protein MglA n=1 Tax=bioreactor metagenome TaxID=1076179 RepID=A0A645AKU7_9ZZZZ|nr:ABC transporter ATP-binding protein [Christensenella sp.]
MENITKTFGSVIANNKVNIEIRHGEILSLLGENGSGKTTLMNMLSGIYLPDSGKIYVDGKEVSITSPKDAFDLHIGMIHQHFKLVDVLTAAENIILGLNESTLVDLKKVRTVVKDICDLYGFVVNPDKKVYDMSVSEKQTLEIVKVLYRGADILILDEPTAVLTPQETQKLFSVMRNMKACGKSIIIITHKLHEVLEISDRVAVLRKGNYIGDVPTSETDAMKLTEMMVGRAVVLDIQRCEPMNPKPRLVVKNLTVCDSDGVKRLDDICFTAYSGEILGIAGISGSGQKELLEAIAGLQGCRDCSSIRFIAEGSDSEKELSGMHPIDIKDLGIALAFVPEDRLGMGLVGSMNLTDNMMLRSYSSGRGPFVDRIKPKKLAETVVRELEVVTPNLNTPVRRLSGGNVQKVLVGREIAQKPQLLMSAYAVRGLDINTSYNIYHLLSEQKSRGAAVIYVGEDLDVLLELCDRILVLCSGKVSGIVDARQTTKEEVGLLMTHLNGGATA